MYTFKWHIECWNHGKSQGNQCLCRLLFMVIQNDNVVYNMNIFPTIKSCLMCLLPSFLNLDQYPISKPNTNWQLLQSHTPKATLSSNVGQRIACTSAWLQHDVMNNASSPTCKIGQIPNENIIHYHVVMLHV